MSARLGLAAERPVPHGAAAPIPLRRASGGAMTARTRSVPLPAYPSILLTPKRDPLSEPEHRLCFEALVTHYGLADKFGFGLSGQYRVSQGGSRITAGAWAQLAFCLACDFVPALRIPRRRGRSKAASSLGAQELLALALEGHSLTAMNQGEISQALFVAAVRKAKGKNSLQSAFKRLATERGRKELPAPYRNRKTPESLKKAWLKIPKAIQENPDIYLRPQRTGLFGIPPGFVPALGQPLPSLFDPMPAPPAGNKNQ